MRKMMVAVLALGLAAGPLAALAPLGLGLSADGHAAELTRKKKKAAPPPAKSAAAPVKAVPAAPAIDPKSFDGKLLAAHNAERTRLGIVPLSWSPKLAREAAAWARNLASRNLFEHSRDRQGAGENLWAGTAGYFSPESMIGAFVGEGKYFRPGKFPDVSTTGDWSDIGHYTQLIWPATRELGCALATGNDRDVLVCRYFPAGNVMGQKVP